MSEIERAIDLQRNRIAFECDCYPKDIDEFILTVLVAELDREKNEPLTWDELKAMEGKAVYIKMLSDTPKYPSCWSIIGKTYTLSGAENVEIADAYQSESGAERKYGISWLAYRYEPKGEKA